MEPSIVVVVAGSRSSHLSQVGELTTLCGRAWERAHKVGVQKPLCRSCDRADKSATPGRTDHVGTPVA